MTNELIAALGAFGGVAMAALVWWGIYQSNLRKKWRTEDKAESVARDLEELRRVHTETALRVATHDTRITVLASEQLGVRSSVDALTRVVEKLSDQMLTFFRNERSDK